jgi:hypothetical protein
VGFSSAGENGRVQTLRVASCSCVISTTSRLSLRCSRTDASTAPGSYLPVEKDVAQPPPAVRLAVFRALARPRASVPHETWFSKRTAIPFPLPPPARQIVALAAGEHATRIGMTRFLRQLAITAVGGIGVQSYTQVSEPSRLRALRSSAVVERPQREVPEAFCPTFFRRRTQLRWVLPLVVVSFPTPTLD